MSEFKVGDKVVLVGTGTKDVLLEVVEHMYTPNMHRVRILSTGQYGPVFKNDIRQATPEEIAAGHRIEKCLHEWNETTSNGDKYRFFVCKHCDSTRNFEPLGVLEHEENHISPNCEVKNG